MQANDLKFEELFSIGPAEGFPLFGDHRMLILNVATLKRFTTDIKEIMGRENMAHVFIRLGHELGMIAAMAISDMYQFDTPIEWFEAGGKLLRMIGFAMKEVKTLDFDVEKKSLHMSGNWHDSVEALLYTSQNDAPSEQPVCFMLQGLASGYSSAVLGKEVWVRETKCAAQGHSHCCFEANSNDNLESKPDLFQMQPIYKSLDKEISRLRKVIDNSQREIKQKAIEIERLKTDQKNRATPSHGIIFRSSSMANVITLAEKVAPTPSTALIYGESGSGKELIAQFIHQESGRKELPFLAVNCAALPANLLESELFGHVKGAFTGADTDKKGLLACAGKGTFFLDEVGELPIELQGKLLRVLQEKEIRPVGSNISIPFEARIIAATNKDLKILIENRLFREDLFYRLSVFPLNILPLRNRKEDILILSRHFLSCEAPFHPGFSPDAIRLMETYTWPGNVRELKNSIEYAHILAKDEIITETHLPQTLLYRADDFLKTHFTDLPTQNELNSRYIQYVISKTNGNRTEAAKILGISITTLWRYLKKNKI